MFSVMFPSMFSANCPRGSYGDGTECTLCSLGEYQELEGQTECMSCPEGFTTEDIGSSSNTDCIEGKETLSLLFHTFITDNCSSKYAIWINCPCYYCVKLYFVQMTATYTTKATKNQKFKYIFNTD